MKRTLVACLLLTGSSLLAQTGAKNGEWPTYGGDLGNTRYSELDQINAANFDDQEIDPLSPDIGLHSAPLVAGNTVVVGAAHKPGGVPVSKTNVKGYVRGFDVLTGKRLWIFHTIPKPGEFGLNTWEQDSWAYT